MSYTISLNYLAPQGLWHATASNSETQWRLGGLFTSAEAALAACWLTTDERIELPGIATYAQVRELLNARCRPDPADDDDEILLASQQDSSAAVIAAVVTGVPA